MYGLKRYADGVYLDLSKWDEYEYDDIANAVEKFLNENIDNIIDHWWESVVGEAEPYSTYGDRYMITLYPIEKDYFYEYVIENLFGRNANEIFNIIGHEDWEALEEIIEDVIEKIDFWGRFDSLIESAVIASEEAEGSEYLWTDYGEGWHLGEVYLYFASKEYVEMWDMVEKGKAAYLGFYDYPNGAVYLVNYKGEPYVLVHDGTGNEFFHTSDPEKPDIKFLIRKYGLDVVEEAFEEVGLDLSDFIDLSEFEEGEEE